MNAAMALSANIYATLKLRFVEVFFKVVTPVHLSRYKMMKRKARFSFTTGAFAYFIRHFFHLGFFTLIYFLRLLCPYYAFLLKAFLGHPLSKSSHQCTT